MRQMPQFLSEIGRLDEKIAGFQVIALLNQLVRALFMPKKAAKCRAAICHVFKLCFAG